MLFLEIHINNVIYAFEQLTLPISYPYLHGRVKKAPAERHEIFKFTIAGYLQHVSN